MLFTSVTFGFFLIFVFTLYWFVFNRNIKYQNIFLLCCSYLFYGWWDYRFLILLFFISFSNYLIAIQLKKTEKGTLIKGLFILGLIINIGVLVIFKYFNFFIDGFINVVSLFGITLNLRNLNIIMPVGISFYIFLCISYLVDVKQKKIQPAKNFVDTLLAFSFFPIILAGPIQRPIGLLPQIQSVRTFQYEKAKDGLKQILWGVFMKIVIADNCAVSVDTIFSNSINYSGSTLILGIILYAIQIYADFAGYSNIAIGVGKLIGFEIMQNFNYPYFSRDIREFWKKWNMSLTSWFRDYVFLPIAYSISRKIKTDRFCLIKTEFIIYTVGITVTWILTGLWHGANYTFILWGLIHGFFLIMNHLISKPRKRLLKRLHISGDGKILVIADFLLTTGIILFSWIFFRADNVGNALTYISGIFSSSFFSIPSFLGMKTFFITVPFIMIFFILEWTGRNWEYAIAEIGSNWYKPVRWIMYYCIIATIIWFSGKEQQFIYFQF